MNKSGYPRGTDCKIFCSKVVLPTKLKFVWFTFLICLSIEYYLTISIILEVRIAYSWNVFAKYQIILLISNYLELSVWLLQLIFQWSIFWKFKLLCTRHTWLSSSNCNFWALFCLIHLTWVNPLGQPSLEKQFAVIGVHLA